MTIRRRLLLSFWDIDLENLPEGAFTRRRVDADEARLRIRQAREADGLLCVCEDDILAPYGEKARDRHEAMCGVLGERFDIDISLGDFCGQEEDEEGALHFINPLNCVTIDEGRSLMVVTCAYEFAPREPGSEGMPLFVIAPSSVTFHMFEAA